MITKRLLTYTQFVKEGRPYDPVYDVQTDRLLLPNFSINPDYSYHNAKRLVVTSGTVYNSKLFCAVWVCSVSCCGLRYKWLYFKNLKYGWFRLRWYELSTYEKALVSRAYVRHMHDIDIPIAPSKHYRHFASWL